MCWASRIKPKRSIAIRDIPVYKILTYDPATDGYISPFYYWRYKFKEKAESILDIPQLGTAFRSIPDPIYFIDKGLHSYRKKSLRKGQKRPYSSYIEVITQGLSISRYKISVDWRLKYLKREVLCSAHIPKGASYYLNECGEYVSDTLVIDKVLDVDKELKTLDIDKRIRARILKRSK